MVEALEEDEVGEERELDRLLPPMISARMSSVDARRALVVVSVRRCECSCCRHVRHTEERADGRAILVVAGMVRVRWLSTVKSIAGETCTGLVDVGGN